MPSSRGFPRPRDQMHVSYTGKQVLYHSRHLGSSIVCVCVCVCMCVYVCEALEKINLTIAPHSSTLACKIPWTEEPGRLQSMGSLRVGHD